MANTYSLSLTNPGAETGDMTGWTNSGMQANTGVSLFGKNVPANTGTYFFKGTYNTSAANAYQDIAITNDQANNDIDSNTCQAFFSWSQNSYSSGNDNGRVELEFLNSSGTSLNVTRSSNTSYTAWTRRNLDETTVPGSTRTIRVRMVSIRASGTDNDGYFDDFSNVLIVAGGANGEVNVATVYTEVVTPVSDALVSNVATVYTEVVTPVSDALISNVATVYTEVVTPVSDALLSNVATVYTEAITTLPDVQANVYQMYVEVVSDVSQASLPAKWKNKSVSGSVLG